MFTSVQEVINMIEQRKNRGYGLQHFHDYMDSIGNPHHDLKAIHVAGTNGKGSTTNDLRSILQEAGYKVGSFTSPYMITHLDRIRINDVDIHEEAFLRLANQYYDSWMQWDLSMFEIDMCIACLYFREEKTDFCVFEVGLGGRLDATNILSPLVGVITNIGMDHMAILGNTLEQIAGEKAGIMKEQMPLFTAENKAECLQVFEARAKELHSIVYPIQEIKKVAMVQGHIHFSYGNLLDIELASGARYQCRNAALAIEVIMYMRNQGLLHVTDAVMKEGLRKAIWIGRFEVVQKDPLILLDGAHNADGIHALCESVKYVNDPIVIFSVLRDKNFEEMLDELQNISTRILVTQFQNERSLDMNELKHRPNVHFMNHFTEALASAITMKRPIIITGSLYFISEVRKNWHP